MKIKLETIPLLIIIAGITFSLYLLFHIRDETFFSGDGALKFLIAKQFSSGKFHIDIYRPVDDWVRNIWLEGLYPFGDKEPWVYYRDNRYYSPFPFTFSLVTAPFYAIFGFRGLYIIPILSLWMIWFSFYRMCQDLKIGTFLTAIALILLIFSSPLTMYGAMYWEHTLAVALAFHGLVVLFTPHSQEISTKAAILSGLLIGLSVWFRGEFLCFVGIICLLTLANTRIKFSGEFILLLSGIIFGFFVLTKEASFLFIVIICWLAYAASQSSFIFKKKEYLLASMLGIICVYWILNTIIYHHPLGIHALQVVEHLSLRSRIIQAVKFFSSMNYELFYYFPIAIYPIAYIFINLFKKKIRISPQIKILFAIYLLFASSVALLLPSDGGKQWGPRFLLILIPVISLLAVMVWQATLKSPALGFKYISSALLFILIILGIYINTYLGAKSFNQKSLTSDLLAFMRKDRNEIVAVNHEFVSQSLAPVFNNKLIFLTKKPEKLLALGKALSKQGYKEFIYICQRYN